MQRLQRRTQKAVAHAARQAAQHKNRVTRLDQIRTDRNNAQVSRHRRVLLDEAKRERWEKWHLGPLAPVRPEREEDKMALPARYLRPGRISNREKAKMGRKQAGATRLLRKPFGLSFRVGERVCCVATQGPAKRYRGRISTVTEVRAGEKACLVDGLNRIPTNRRRTALDPNPPKYIHTPIPISSLLPVRTLHNPHTQMAEDVIIGLSPNHRIVANSPPLDPSDPFSPTATARARASLAAEIAEKKEKREKERRTRESSEKTAQRNKEHDIDTLRYEVEARTWTPTLLRAPMPGGVVDELRGKYSKFRTWHEPAYVQRLARAEQEKRERETVAREGGGLLVSPLKELSLEQRAKEEEAAAAARKHRGGQHVVVPEGVLEQIGRKMAERGLSLPIVGEEEGDVDNKEKEEEEDVELSSSSSSSSSAAVSAPAADADDKALGKDVAVAAAERDEYLQQEKRRRKEEAVRYWPVKGWKEKGGAAAGGGGVERELPH
ncbi:MAG: hypothetical protein Q9163_006165 [Psora crenata]